MDANSVHEHGENTSPPPVEEASTPAEDTQASEPDHTPTPETEVRDTTTESRPATTPVETTQPAEPQPTVDPTHPHVNTPGVIVLQWLTYAFWGWLILGLLWLMSVILVNAILGESVNEVVPYAIAASLVLFPLSFVCDTLYRKHEPTKKTGAAMVIMVIHAVLFAILGILSLIIAVFIGINALINIGDPLDSQMVGLSVAAFAALLYAGAFVRTLNPFKTKKPAFGYGIAMAVVTVALLAFAIVGPVVSSIATRGDRLIEQALPRVQTSIDSYISDNNKLPSSLNDVTITDSDAKNLVDEGKVEYKAIGKLSETTLDETLSTSSTYRYQLCVEYKAEKNNETTRYSYSDEDGYTNYISTYSHGAGKTCYKVQQTAYKVTN